MTIQPAPRADIFLDSGQPPHSARFAQVAPNLAGLLAPVGGRASSVGSSGAVQAQDPPVFDPGSLLRDLFAYARDAGERSVLSWDTLRQRAADMLAQERAGKPPLLGFDYEVLVDARRFERPVNYALLRVTRVGDHCLTDCLDTDRPSVTIFDPRAGQGPGIGSFKRDSEVGVALHQGHAVYFIAFYPEPGAGQTLADMHHALRRFVEEVARRPAGKAPVLYGNCQAGWTVTLLAAECEGLAGPTVLNGASLSYWAGETGINPMRIAAGFGGGAWLIHCLSDLGDGRLDGAWRIQNFESLKPEAVWEKYARLFTDMDAERDRFLAFERWCHGFYFLGREEILAVVGSLFVGNRLEQGRLRICAGCYADLWRIRNPLVIFARSLSKLAPTGALSHRTIPARYARPRLCRRQLT